MSEIERPVFGNSEEIDGSAFLQEKRASDKGQVKVIPNVSEWHLCNSSEWRMTKAIEEGGLILVNDTFMVKVRGKIAGVAVKGRTEQDLRLDTDYWYVPESLKTRRLIRKAFDSGVSQVNISEASEWAKVRPVDTDPCKISDSDFRAQVMGALDGVRNNTIYTSDVPRWKYRKDKEELDGTEKIKIKIENHELPESYCRLDL